MSRKIIGVTVGTAMNPDRLGEKLGSSLPTVRYDKAQKLTPEQKAQARANIGAGTPDDIANADEVYIVGESETESDIPENTVIAVFPNEDAEETDFTNYYTKPEIDEIIIKAEFKKGKSAYEIAVEQGFEGSEAEWVASLKGKDGYTPQKGVDYFDGKDGKTPVKDVDYFDGYTPQKGTDYFDGEDGEDGYTPQRGIDYWTDSDIATMQTAIMAELVGTAPDALDTLWELANALGNDPNFATTITNLIGKKVDKVDGKGLSTNDYTTSEKNKLAGLSNYTHPSSHPASMITGLSKVATSNKYSDLDGKPTILSASNKGYNGAITAGGDGVAEMGKYIDFHNTANGTSDYSTRMMCTGEHGNTVSLPSATGTLVVGDRALKVVITSSAPTTNDTSVMTIQL